jgi:hypothetical protein
MKADQRVNLTGQNDAPGKFPATLGEYPSRKLINLTQCFKQGFMQKSFKDPNGIERWARNLFLHVVLLITVSGCAPLKHSYTALNGGGSGSTCEFEGLFRGSDCVDSITSVYLSDETWRDRPRVCGSLTTWGVFGTKNWRPGNECSDDLPTYCQSSVLIPGLDNQTLKDHDVLINAQLDKKRLCSLPMTAQLLLYKGTQAESKIIVVWSNAVFMNTYGKTIRIEKPGENLVTYCHSSVLVPGVDEQMLKDYGILKEAVHQKAKLCDEPQ